MSAQCEDGTVYTKDGDSMMSNALWMLQHYNCVQQ